MPPSRLDGLYRKLLITKFFEKGWGKPENLKRLFEFRKVISNREACTRLVPDDYPVQITKTEKTSECTILEGNFFTPLEFHLPGLVPKASKKAHFQVLLPNKWRDERFKPMCIHLAGTGDHYFWRRRNFIAKPLLREGGIGAIILENPFYGVRKPEDQVRSNLHNVSDIFVMGGCLILESLVLLKWCEKMGFGPLGITGLSMGGHMASLAATNWPKPLVLVPCLSWSTAASVFTQGVMSQSINWDILETQYFSDGNFRERLAKMVTVIDDAFMAGQHFVKNFNESMQELRRDMHEVKQNEIAVRTDTGSYIVPYQGKGTTERSLIKINNQTSFPISKDLYEKLKSNQILTNSEIDLVNERIRIIQDKLRREKQQNEFLENPAKISTQTLLETCNITTNNKPSSAVVQSKTKDLVKVDSEESTLTKLMSYILPSPQQTNVHRIDTTKDKWWEHEALQFMRGMMDECTHLKNFSVPYDTSLIIAVCAKDDAYVPREGCSSLEDIWPGAEVRYLDAGHVSAYVLHQKLFRSCIIEAFERAKKQLGENANIGQEYTLNANINELKRIEQPQP
uniref:Protein ABHD18 n=1 Tax=Tabanus bromius TaxID=304241 RepID=A0A0K8TRX4_TABBR